MLLKHTEIPIRFLAALPEGVKLVNRHGKEYLVIEQLLGPSGESLVSEMVHIHNEPAVFFGMRIGNSEGFVFVDPFWGSHAKLYSFIPDLSQGNCLREAYSPETGDSLMVDWACGIEGCDCAKSIEFRLPGGGNRIYVCARLGCPGHRMEIARLPHGVSDTISRINYFGTGDEDAFKGI